MLHNRIHRYTLWSLTLLSPIAPLMGQAEPTLEAHVLPSLFDDRTATVALDINDQGQIVGWSTNSAEKTRATLWNQQGEPRRLACPEGTTECSAVAINDSGNVVGDATPVRFSQEYAFIVRWNPNGEVSRVTTPPANGILAAYANDISDQGFVVGSAEAYTFGDDAGAQRATLWRRNGAPTKKLRPLVGASGTALTSDAVAVNDNRLSPRLVVGVTRYASNVNIATAWDRNGRARALPPLSGHDSSQAHSVNRQGTVAGISQLPILEDDGYVFRVSTAVAWGSNGRPVALKLMSGCSQSSAEEINDAGFVVGSNSACAGRPGDVAVIWNPEGDVFELPLPAGFIEGEALAINSQGDVVGYAVERKGKTVAIVWR